MIHLMTLTAHPATTNTLHLITNTLTCWLHRTSMAHSTLCLALTTLSITSVHAVHWLAALHMHVCTKCAWDALALDFHGCVTVSWNKVNGEHKRVELTTHTCELCDNVGGEDADSDQKETDANEAIDPVEGRLVVEA